MWAIFRADRSIFDRLSVYRTDCEHHAVNTSARRRLMAMHKR